MLAFDVGAHNGSDTAHYLEMGFRVVCIEASPDLAGKLRKRFAVEIAQGRCVVRNIGERGQRFWTHQVLP